MDEILETAGPYRVGLEADQDARNPRREFDHLCHVLTVPHSHYIDVDDDGGPLQEGWDRIKNRTDAVDVFTRWARIFHGAVVDYHTPERGPVSVWYLLPEQFSEVPDPLACIKAEIEEYQNWADGEVYGYIIEEAVDWVRKDNEDEEMSTWEQVDDGSCWGFFGYKYAKESALEAFAPYREKAEAISK